ncbi:MAG: 5'-deoxynucleotidase [Clostridia bacterium]|nr:5'-deoxynucleotidase [Clostridia bacterium]MBO7319763.1 5'-deoxynucleotidase [Clostridia bacterium]
MSNHFFAMHSRMKYINRWALMRNTVSENISEHSNDVAVIAHALAVIKNVRFGGNLNAERAAFLGLYHDMTEIITGDMPTPVKYHSEDMREAFQEVEDKAGRKLLAMLPEDMSKYYESAFFKAQDDEYLWQIVKAADKISALIKCIEEKNAGNNEFGKALESTRAATEKMNMPEVQVFLDEFLPSFYLSLDEQNESCF